MLTIKSLLTVFEIQFISRIYVSWWTKLAAFVKGKLPVNEHSPNLWHTYFEQLLFTVARKQANRLPENKSLAIDSAQNFGILSL